MQDYCPLVGLGSVPGSISELKLMAWSLVAFPLSLGLKMKFSRKIDIAKNMLKKNAWGLKFVGFFLHSDKAL